MSDLRTLIETGLDFIAVPPEWDEERQNYKKISKGFRMIEWLNDTRHLSKKELQEVVDIRRKNYRDKHER